MDSGTSVQKKPSETQCVANLRTPKCSSSSSSLVPSGRPLRQMSGAARRHSCTGPHVQRCCCLRYAKKLAGSCARPRPHVSPLPLHPSRALSRACGARPKATLRRGCRRTEARIARFGVPCHDVQLRTSGTRRHMQQGTQALRTAWAPGATVLGRAARPVARASFSTVTSLRYTPAQPAMYARRLRSMSSTVVRLFQPPAARMALARHTPARAPQLNAA